MSVSSCSTFCTPTPRERRQQELQREIATGKTPGSGSAGIVPGFAGVDAAPDSARSTDRLGAPNPVEIRAKLDGLSSGGNQNAPASRDQFASGYAANGASARAAAPDPILFNYTA